MSAKGFVAKRGGTWLYTVYDSEPKIVLCDNTNNWRRMFDECFDDTAAIRRIEQAGHKLRYSYPQLVDQAAGL